MTYQIYWSVVISLEGFKKCTERWVRVDTFSLQIPLLSLANLLLSAPQ
jgi:hypothetical protein